MQPRSASNRSRNGALYADLAEEQVDFTPDMDQIAAGRAP